MERRQQSRNEGNGKAEAGAFNPDEFAIGHFMSLHDKMEHILKMCSGLDKRIERVNTRVGDLSEQLAGTDRNLTGHAYAGPQKAKREAIQAFSELVGPRQQMQPVAQQGTPQGHTIEIPKSFDQFIDDFLSYGRGALWALIWILTARMFANLLPLM